MVTPKFKTGHVTYFKFGGPIHLSGMAEARAVKLCTQVGYIKSYRTGGVSRRRVSRSVTRPPVHA